MSKDERVVRRRLQHRQIDANRRNREADAIHRLDTLIHQQAGDFFTSDDTSDLSVPQAKTDRVSVLERGIESLSSQHSRIQLLQLTCARMEAACQARDRQLTQFVRHLHEVAAAQGLDFSSVFRSSSAYFTSLSDLSASTPLFPFPSTPALYSHLSHADRCHSLSAACSLSSKLCMTMKLMPEGLFVDATERFLEVVRFSREEFLLTSIHRNHPRCCPTLVPPEMERKMEEGAPVKQFGSTKEEIRAMLRGEHAKATFSWRCRTGDGRILEVDSFMVDAGDDDGDGVSQGEVGDDFMRRRRVVCVHSMGDAMLVEEIRDKDAQLED